MTKATLSALFVALPFVPALAWALLNRDTLGGFVSIKALGRLFDNLPAELIELELVRRLQAPGTLHLRYDVQSQ